MRKFSLITFAAILSLAACGDASKEGANDVKPHSSSSSNDTVKSGSKKTGWAAYEVRKSDWDKLGPLQSKLNIAGVSVGDSPGAVLNQLTTAGYVPDHHIINPAAVRSASYEQIVKKLKGEDVESDDVIGTLRAKKDDETLLIEFVTQPDRVPTVWRVRYENENAGMNYARFYPAAVEKYGKPTKETTGSHAEWGKQTPGNGPCNSYSGDKECLTLSKEIMGNAIVLDLQSKKFNIEGFARENLETPKTTF